MDQVIVLALIVCMYNNNIKVGCIFFYILFTHEAFYILESTVLLINRIIAIAIFFQIGLFTIQAAYNIQ